MKGITDKQTILEYYYGFDGLTALMLHLLVEIQMIEMRCTGTKIKISQFGTKAQLFNTNVKSVVLCGCETWQK